MDPSLIVKKLCWGLVTASGVWIGCVLLCTKTWVQRHVFYAHKVPIWWGQRLNEPETLGFLRHQVTPFQIPTRDRQLLYTWLVTPLRLYAQNESDLLNDPSRASQDIKKTVAFNLLANDPESRLVIYFHGNAGTVGQTRRTDAYRMISSGAPDKIHVLAFDYRGFGNSSGTPTEEGLIIDAIEVIKWATEVANIPFNRIILLAQSLGTALAAAAANHFIRMEPKGEFAGVILCAGFTDAATIFQSYSIGGFLPLLAPLQISSTLQNWFFRHMTDTWKTSNHIDALVKNSRSLRLTLVHAINDNVIPWEQTNELFSVAVNAATEGDMSQDEIDAHMNTIDLDEGGWIQSYRSEDLLIKKRIVRHGGHNGIMKWAPVSLATVKSFGIV
ncbi:MAG: hypothetical protein M1833_005999 [Piccolia ochrophora]|nr:MAG: hypothetical protein M1833_005999 [Piccolia ochrophora]